MVAPAQRAIAAVAERAAPFEQRDKARLEQLVGRDADELGAAVRGNTRITVNFHPDRLDRHGRSVAAGLAASGAYLTQATTGISNGMRYAPDGDRTKWEAALFGDAYAAGADPLPVYGALDLTADPHGGSPRFGSCFLVLRPEIFDRATFSFGDSHLGPTDVGTIGHLGAVLAAAFEQAGAGDGLSRGLDVEDLVACIDGAPRTMEPARELDGYIETQIHGGVSLADDVARVVVDPSFASTDVETQLRAAADTFGFELGWHGGSELAAAAVPANLRGPTMLALAARVARADGVIDAAAIGRHAASIAYTAPQAEGDAPESEVQQIKYLWHCLLLLGASASGRR